MQYSANRPFLRYNYPPTDRDDDSESTIEALRQQNASLRKRLDRFIEWEKKLDAILKERSSPSTLPFELSIMVLPHQTTFRSGIRLKRPLTVEDCHAIVRDIYPEIASFNGAGKEGSISTGASVFGWTDQRRVDNGLVKFAISKINTRMNPEEVSSGIWAFLSSPTVSARSSRRV